MNPQELLEIVLQLQEVIPQLSPEEQSQAAPFIDRIVSALDRLSQHAQRSEPQADTLQSQIPPIARELWTLSNGDPDVFELYMQQYPDKDLNRIASNRAELESMIAQISNSQQLPQRPEIDGIPPAPLRSSNVYGFRYSPEKRELKVRFNEGQVYKYDSVPPIIWDMFKSGASAARTKGSNRWGRWWKGKRPSYGASVHQILIAGKFPYQRVA